MLGLRNDIMSFLQSSSTFSGTVPFKTNFKQVVKVEDLNDKSKLHIFLVQSVRFLISLSNTFGILQLHR